MVSHSSKAAIIAHLTGMQLLRLSVTPEEPAGVTAFSGILALLFISNSIFSEFESSGTTQYCIVLLSDTHFSKPYAYFEHG